MQAVISNFIRVFIAIAMSLATVPAGGAADCGAPAAGRRCGCCKNADAGACCRAQENRTPTQPPATPPPRVSPGAQPAALLPSHAPMIAIPVVRDIFPVENHARCAGSAGHTFQSVRCRWMV